MSGDNPNAKRLREQDKKNKAANESGPKSELHHSKGSPKSGLKKPIRQPKKG